MKLRKLINSAVMVALMAITAQLFIPLPFSDVPITLQVFGVFLALLTMERRFAVLTVIIYIVLGVIGVPVFAGFTSGVGILFGPSGGYLWGFLPAVFFAGFINGNGLKINCLKLFVCIAIIYIFGTIQLARYFNFSLTQAITIGVLPYLIPDILKAVLAVVVAKSLFKYLKYASF